MSFTEEEGDFEASRGQPKMRFYPQLAPALRKSGSNRVFRERKTLVSTVSPKSAEHTQKLLEKL